MRQNKEIKKNRKAHGCKINTKLNHLCGNNSIQFIKREVKENNILNKQKRIVKLCAGIIELNLKLQRKLENVIKFK